MSFLSAPGDEQNMLILRSIYFASYLWFRSCVCNNKPPQRINEGKMRRLELPCRQSTCCTAHCKIRYKKSLAIF